MAEPGEDEGRTQTLDEALEPPPISKRKHDLDCAEAGEGERRAKNPKPDLHEDPVPNVNHNDENANGDQDDGHEDEEYQGGDDDDAEQTEAEEDEEEEAVKAAAVDKGKGKMIVEEDDNSDGSSDDSSSDGDVIGGVGEEGEDSDFEDDPLAEVDLDNILPSRTRRRPPPPPGAYLVNEQEGEDEDDDDESE